jgi:hypothetical protein
MYFKLVRVIRRMRCAGYVLCMISVAKLGGKRILRSGWEDNIKVDTEDGMLRARVV